MSSGRGSKEGSPKHLTREATTGTTGPAEKVFIVPTLWVPLSLPRRFSYRVESQLGWAHVPPEPHL